MDLQEKLKRVLEAALKMTECHLETSATGRVGGLVVSEAFGGRSQVQRQELIWAELRKHLAPEELIQVMALLTLTPEELGDVDPVAATGL